MLNSNVRLTLVFRFLLSVVFSLSFNQVLAQYIYVLRHSNMDVGVVTGAKGVVQLLFALPAGVLADRWVGRACCASQVSSDWVAPCIRRGSCSS